MAISRPMFQPFSPSRFASSLSSSAFGSFSSSFSLPRLITVHLRVRAHTCWLLLNRPLQISHPWSSDGKRHEVDAFEFSTQKILPKPKLCISSHSVLIIIPHRYNPLAQSSNAIHTRRVQKTSEVQHAKDD